MFQPRSLVSALLLVGVIGWTSGCRDASQDDAADGLQPPVVSDAMVADSDPSSLPGPPEKLGVGDPSPGLKIANWIRGEPVQAPLRDRVHVVEFWATWCGPCRSGMPHISELQNEFADEVTFIGVTDEDEATVAGFLGQTAMEDKTWDDVIEYRLAIDSEGWMNRAYMKAAGQGGIPCAFVVGRDGIIEWIGHPGTIDQPLQEIVAGTWDRQAAIAEYKQQEKLQELAAEVSAMLREQEYDAALERMNQFEKAEGTSKTLLNYRVRVLEIAGRTNEAAVAREALVQAAWDDAMLLSQIAWTTATNGDPSDLELALKAAKRASQLRDNEDASILDTVARCYYELGRLDEAIKWQRQAVEHSDGQKQIEATLKSYLDEQADAEQAESGDKASEPKDADSGDTDSGVPAADDETGEAAESNVEADQEPAAE
ncbi:redoxin domain-containing protein [Rhodopirellula sp. JC639]|uniref:redoxin domain-containing protein n=1 Tax=Stieleria mannarensis TaxID=2755585 RepID=UPI0016024760|nr:redoxin domain-containing protein [Rhodopirellula sp. JC639]